MIARYAARVNGVTDFTLTKPADDDLTTPLNDEPEYLRALFNTESTWAAAQNAK